MKNLILSMSVLLFVATSAFAQVSIGIKTGVNFASFKFKTEDFYEKKSGTGFHGGAYASVKLNKNVSLQTELLYNSLSVVVDDEVLTSAYISYPMLLVVGFSDNKINIQAGPQIGFLTSTDPGQLKDMAFYNGSDFTFNLGAGVNLNKINVTLRYGIGLANIAGDALTQQVPDYTIKDNNLQFSVGYTIFAIAEGRQN